jgi:UDP-4-amino-4,6-dideoxy-N-acetyl-beta-L-altrosamine transaminase
MLNYSRQEVTQQDIDAVVAVMRSDFLTQGPAVLNFELTVAQHVGARHAIALNSATSALHLACLALGLGAGDWLWTSPITFVASANCALYCGAKVDFVDIDAKTYNLCPAALEAKLIAAERQGKLPKIVVAVHLSGQSCDMEAIHKLALKYGFKIIEDASHALGGMYKGAYIGGSAYSDITVFSFHPLKIITTAEGGMAVTNDDELAERIALLRSHGVTRDSSKMTREADGPWYYEQVALGLDYRMNDIQGALGCSQMNRLTTYAQSRHKMAERYDVALRDFPLTTPWQHPDSYSALHLYVVRLQLDRIKLSRRAVFDRLRADNIGVNVHYIPVHTQPYYRQMGFAAGDFPEAEKYYSEAISIPIFSSMTDEQQNHVVVSLHAALDL